MLLAPGAELGKHSSASGSFALGIDKKKKFGPQRSTDLGNFITRLSSKFRQMGMGVVSEHRVAHIISRSRAKVIVAPNYPRKWEVEGLWAALQSDPCIMTCQSMMNYIFNNGLVT